MCGGGGGGPTMGSKTNPMLPPGTKFTGGGLLGLGYLASQQKAAAQTATAAAPAEPPAPTATPYDPGPYGPRITVTTAPAEMPNAGSQASSNAAEALQVSADAIKRNRSSYRTAGMSGLNIPGAA